MFENQPAAQGASVVEGVSLLGSIVEQSRVAKSDSECTRAKDITGELASQMLSGTVAVSDNLSTTLDARMAELDRLIPQQLSAITHAPEFQKLESTWRGLYYLVKETSTDQTIKIKALNVTRRDLTKDFKTAIEFDQNVLFKKVYEEEFGTLGGAPFGALIGDYEIMRQPEDMYFTEQTVHVVAVSYVPFIALSSPRLLGLESFADLGKPRDPAKMFDTVEHAKWKSFHNSEDSRYADLTLPRFLGRPPYNPKDGTVVENLNFAEDVDGTDHSKYLWCNAVWAFGTHLIAAFDDFGWCVAIRGAEDGDPVEDPPTYTFKADDGEIALKCLIEIAITDRREEELSDLGLILLVYCKNTDYATFFVVQSAQKAKKYDSDSANADVVPSAQLQHIFSVSRVAHYLKAMMRDKIGSSALVKNVETFLNRWISQYVLLDDNATQEQKVQFPLYEASTQVAEVPGKPGTYRSVAFLWPYFQLDELSISLRLVADPPKSANP